MQRSEENLNLIQGDLLGLWLSICFWRIEKRLSFTLRSWLHQNLTRIILVPWIGEQPYVEMLFGLFSNINIYVKIVRKMQDQHLMYHYSPIQGTRSTKEWKLWDESVPYFQQESWPCPLDWRRIMHWNVVLAFFKQPWYMRLRCKITVTTFLCMVVLQSRGQDSNSC